MPVYRLSAKIDFPPPELATDYDGLLAVGGDLSEERLLTAYANGIFPWPCEELPLAWWSPDPRFVLYPHALTVSKSLARVLKKNTFTYTVDRCFAEVIGHCRKAKRVGQDGTWITAKMEKAYIALHRAGYAHSVEAWAGDRLAGGLYGVSIGCCFFGESMFAHEPDASKCAFVRLVEELQKQRCPLVDCQVYTEHLARFGAVEIPRTAFLEQLRAALLSVTSPINWESLASALS